VSINERLKIRADVDRYLVDGPTFMNAVYGVTQDLISIVLLFGRDSRAEPYATWLLRFYRQRHLVALVNYAAVLTEAIYADYFGKGDLKGDGHSPSYYPMLLAARDVIKSDIVAIELGGNDWDRDKMREIREREGLDDFLADVDLMLTRNVSLWSKAINTSGQLLGVGRNISAFTRGAVKESLREELDRLALAAVAEGMKMFVAVVVATLSLSGVIYVNHAEQKRLQVALDGARRLKQAVQRFVPRRHLKSMGVNSIMSVHRGLAMELSQAILFSDIRQFTLLAATMTNMQLFHWLSSYIERTGDVITKHRGYISNLVGDAVFAVFNSGTDASSAAVQMHVKVDALNLELVADGKDTLVSIGVGLHSGVLVAGVFGSEDRLSCVHIASHVNFASRLEGLTKTFGSKIIASSAIIKDLSAEVFSWRQLGDVLVAGAIEPIKIYDIFEADPLPLKKHKRATRHEFESAVRMAKTDPERARTIFGGIAQTALDAMLRDSAAEHRAQRIDEVDMDGGVVAAMRFTKEGESHTPLNTSLNRSGDKPPTISISRAGSSPHLGFDEKSAPASRNNSYAGAAAAPAPPTAASPSSASYPSHEPRMPHFAAGN
jgi:class 3 adenylate cyclase